MYDIFDFNRDGKTNFEEKLFGTMLVMGAFDEQNQETDAAFDDDESDEDDL